MELDEIINPKKRLARQMAESAEGPASATSSPPSNYSKFGRKQTPEERAAAAVKLQQLLRNR